MYTYIQWIFQIVYFGYLYTTEISLGFLSRNQFDTNLLTNGRHVKFTILRFLSF